MAITLSANIKILRDHSPEEHIGRYRLVGLLATGGMAEIYLALSGELTGFRTLVVVKRVLPHLASNTDFVQMFFDEARIAALLDHPNIVRILEVGQEQGETFLAMEVVQGKPLSALLRRAVKRNQPLTHAQSSFIVAQVANGLGYAHNLVDTDGTAINLVHRDVSPQNVLVSFEGAVKVIDFGVARALGRLSQTSPGGLKGKIWYMAPEQASSGEVDRRSDVFALGVVLWEALCGRRLFKRATELGTLRAIVDEPVPPPSKLVRISPRLERIVMRALEKKPENRFQTAAEMALALERHVFASEGFSPSQIGAAMKSLFASEHARWKKTVATAMSVEPEEHWPSVEGTVLLPRDADIGPRGTVALRAGAALPLTSSTVEISSETHSGSHTDFTFPERPGLRRLGFLADRRWLVGGIAGLAGLVTVAILVGLFALRPSRGPVTVVRPAASQTVESLPAAPPPPLVVASSALSAAGEDTAAAPDEAGTAPGNGSRHTKADARAERRETKHVARFGGEAARSRAVTITRPAPAPGTCAITVGTRPWSEVWIDGKNTMKHTPYSEKIPCGKHSLTFKRGELGLGRTFAIDVRPGETFKQSFGLK